MLKPAPALVGQPGKQAGFTLIEVLVTVVVLTIGLLGLANLQAVGIRSVHSAYLRSQATQIANTAFDRMRANRPAAMAGEYDIGINDDTGAIEDCTTSACVDVIQWREALQALPSGTGSISVDAAGKATVIVAWNDQRDTESSPSLLQFTLETLI